MSDGDSSGLTAQVTRVASVLIFGALMLTLGVSVAPNINTVAVQGAEVIWPGYAKDLRVDPVQPDCELEALDESLAQCPEEGTPQDEGEVDPFAGGDPFAEDGAGDAGDAFGDEDPFADAAPEPEPATDAFAGEDPFADAAPEPEPADDAFGGGDPFAEPADAVADGGDDPFGGGDPFADAPTAKPDVNCAALRNLRDRCETRWTDFEDKSSRISGSVKTFRSLEGLISDVARFPYWKHLLVLIVGLGALVTTLHREHIALRTPSSLMEHRIRQASELLASVLLLASQIADWSVQQGSTAEAENAELPYLWGGVFALLVLTNLMHLVRPPSDFEDEGSSPPRMLMVIPLFVWMTCISGFYFLLAEGHPSGLAIYLHKFVQIPNIYLGIGLYIWAGMLLARTRIAPLSFGVLEPLHLPPAILAWLVVVLAAFPTAYSGASGIFVIAAGAVVFDRLVLAGASKRLALAATAMSGSLGVVLRPCLVVVLIAILNRQVTTDELFGWGVYVYALTAVLALLAFLKMNDKGFHMAPLGEALPKVFAGFKRVLPFIVLAGMVILGFGFFLGTWLNEHTAPFVVPVAMLVLIVYDKWRTPSEDEEVVKATDPAALPLWPSLLSATRESSHHVGALLMLMACSVGLGGMVERSHIMEAVVPESFGSPWLAMSFLVVVMVLVGMTMDALGAVILVTFTVAGIAYDNGIHPVHFWMMVLVAFELGYLTPPVSLNHLLARQVIGPESYVENEPVPGGSFAQQYEHIIMPMLVMGTALVIVAFVPLAFY